MSLGWPLYQESRSASVLLERDSVGIGVLVCRLHAGVVAFGHGFKHSGGRHDDQLRVL